MRQSVSFSGSSWFWRELPGFRRDRESVSSGTHEWCPNRAQETRVVSPPVRDCKQRAPSTRAPTQEPSKQKGSGENDGVSSWCACPGAGVCLLVLLSISGRPGLVGPLSAASVALSPVVFGVLLSWWAPSRKPRHDIFWYLLAAASPRRHLLYWVDWGCEGLGGVSDSVYRQRVGYHRFDQGQVLLH